MIPAELVDEIEQLQARLLSTKRALNVLQGQNRTAIRLLASFDDELHSLRKRLESTAKEAQEHDSFSGAAIF